MTFEITDHDSSKWLSYYNNLNEDYHDVFYQPGFGKVCQESLYSVHKIQCALFQNSKGVALYPFVLRENFINKQLSFYDITGLYGRGGITTDIKDPSSIIDFHLLFRQYCLKNDIICGFDRYHPITKNHKFADPQIQLIKINDFVVLDLQENIEKIEKMFKHMHRKSIKKAKRAEVKIFFEQSIDHLDDFIYIYHSLLKERNADPFYYFPRSFYEGLVKEIPSNYMFIYAEYDNIIISCELVLMEKFYCHSYLGGTLPEYRHICSNALLKRDIIRYYKDRNYRYYLLGGGSNGIYRYKMGFAPLGSCTSFVGGMIYNEDLYRDLKIELVNNGVEINKNKFQFYDI